MVAVSGWSWLMMGSSVFADLKMSVESLKSQGKVREIYHLTPVATLLVISLAFYSIFFSIILPDDCKQMSSFGESKADDLADDHPKEFVKHNQFQLSRIYPAGRRTDSSNYNPCKFWNTGCQIGR